MGGTAPESQGPAPSGHETQACVSPKLCARSASSYRETPGLGRWAWAGAIQPGGQVWLMRARIPWLPVTSVVADENRCAQAPPLRLFPQEGRDPSFMAKGKDSL